MGEVRRAALARRLVATEVAAVAASLADEAAARRSSLGRRERAVVVGEVGGSGGAVASGGGGGAGGLVDIVALRGWCWFFFGSMRRWRCLLLFSLSFDRPAGLRCCVLGMMRACTSRRIACSDFEICNIQQDGL